MLFILRTCFPDELCIFMYIYGIGIKEHTLLNLKQTITAQNTHLPIFAVVCSALVICIYWGKRGLRASLTSDVPGMCRRLTLVHVHANY